MIEETSKLRVEATQQVKEAKEKLMDACRLVALNREDYEYFGVHSAKRPVSVGVVRGVNASSLAAFNYSSRVAQLRARIHDNVKTLPLAECLENNRFFSTGSFKRLELDSPHSIELINQSDIFDNRIKFNSF